MTSHERGRLIIEAALVATSARERRPWAEILRRLHEGDRRLHAEFRVALAWAVQHYLRQLLPHAGEIYLVGSSLEEAYRASDVDILLAMPNASETDKASLEALNEDVSRAYSALLPDMPPAFRLLDIHLLVGTQPSPFRAMLTGSNTPRYQLG